MKIKINVEDGKDVFFISDFHLFHKNIIRFDKRPFLTKTGEPDLEAMHRTIVDNWNSVVKPNDVVFFLGDLNFSDPQKAMHLVHELKGTIHFIMGNHDRYEDIKKYNRFQSINDYVDLNINNKAVGLDIHIAIMHYPIYSHNRMSHGSFMIHGHTHGNLHHGETMEYYKNRRVIDVGCNIIDYTPISYTQVVSLLENKFIPRKHTRDDS